MTSLKVGFFGLFCEETHGNYLPWEIGLCNAVGFVNVYLKDSPHCPSSLIVGDALAWGWG